MSKLLCMFKYKRGFLQIIYNFRGLRSEEKRLILAKCQKLEGVRRKQDQSFDENREFSEMSMSMCVNVVYKFCVAIILIY